MVVIRLAILLVLIACLGSLALYAVTRNPRYLDFARRVLQFAFVFAVAFMALYLLERVILVL